MPPAAVMFELRGGAEAAEPVEVGALHHALLVDVGAEEAGAVGFKFGGGPPRREVEGFGQPLTTMRPSLESRAMKMRSAVTAAAISVSRSWLTPVFAKAEVPTMTLWAPPSTSAGRVRACARRRRRARGAGGEELDDGLIVRRGRWRRRGR
jgi:hypothetical protein